MSILLSIAPLVRCNSILRRSENLFKASAFFNHDDGLQTVFNCQKIYIYIKITITPVWITSPNKMFT